MVKWIRDLVLRNDFFFSYLESTDFFRLLFVDVVLRRDFGSFVIATNFCRVVMKRWLEPWFKKSHFSGAKRIT